MLLIASCKRGSLCVRIHVQHRLKTFLIILPKMDIEYRNRMFRLQVDKILCPIDITIPSQAKLILANVGQEDNYILSIVGHGKADSFQDSSIKSVADTQTIVRDIKSDGSYGPNGGGMITG